jgi:CcmD family protein
MGTFVTAYVAVWLALTAYVVRLDMRQRRLENDLKALQSQLHEPEPAEPSTAKAA